jgi:ribosomal protein S18 acetylase RimI-like enzyme
VTDWVARWAGVTAGSVQLVVQPGTAHGWAGHWLSSLTVCAPLRGLGIGEALARVVVERARHEGAGELLLAVQEDDVRAIALYRKLGFERVMVPALEPIFTDELERLGRRRIVMRLPLALGS